MKEKKMTTYDVLHVGDSLYYVSNEFNVLIKSTMVNKCEIIGFIPGEAPDAESLISQLVLIDNRIILIPLNAKKIWVYEINDQKWRGIKIEDESCTYKFMRAIREGNRLYLFPSRYKKIVVFDIMTDEVRYIEIADKPRGICNSTFFRSDVVQKGHMVYAAYCGGDYVFKFNTADETFEWKKVGANCMGYSGIAWDGQQFWLLPKKDEKKVIVWDGNDHLEKMDITTCDGGSNRGITVINNRLYILRDNETITIDCNHKKDEGEREKAYFFYKSSDNSNAFLRYNSEYTWYKDGREHTATLLLSDEAIKSFAGKNLESKAFDSFFENNVARESELFRISDFLRLLSSK